MSGAAAVVLAAATVQVSACSEISPGAEGGAGLHRATENTPPRGPAAMPGAASLRTVALIEYTRDDALGRSDVVYGGPDASYAANAYPPHRALGLALSLGQPGSQRIHLYRCVGEKVAGSGYLFSYFATTPSCDGHDFIGGVVSATPVALIYAPTLPPAQRADKVALYRYWVDEAGRSTSVLSTVAPVDRLLTVMRYQRDPLLGDAPLGYLIKGDARVDGNARWIAGFDQRLCYGISSYQTTCPGLPTPVALRWELRDLATDRVLLVRDTDGSSPMLTVAAHEISDWLNRGLARSNRPLLLTVARGGQILAAKTVRIIRTPFVAQYDNAAISDDGQASFYPTEASALLIGNQMLAHPAYTHPISARRHDPALYDGIVYIAFGDAGIYDPGRPTAAVAAAQRAGFRKLDAQGVLVGAEIAYSFYDKGGFVYPFDDAKRVSYAELNTNRDLVAAPVAESFDPATGRFYECWPISGRPFYADFTRAETSDWLRAGAISYLDRLTRNGVHLSHLSLSEIRMQTGGLPEYNDSRLPYHESPTFSEHAYRAFERYLRSLRAPAEFAALPVLPAHYVVAQQAVNPALHRIQPADPGSGLWRWWAQWRRDVFNRTLGAIAETLKTRHQSYAYTRSPLIVMLYNWLDWVTFEGQKFDWYGSKRSSEYWPFGVLWDAARNELYVDSGQDFGYAQRFQPGLFDYLVYEVKWVPDSVAEQQIQRIVGLRDGAGAKGSRIGLHVEVDTPYIERNADYMNTNLRAVFTPGFAVPQFDLVWAWEAQCEYVMSIKEPDGDGSNEQLSVDATTGRVLSRGSYQSLVDQYSTIVGDWCLLRHQHYNLRKVCDPDCRDRVPMGFLRENLRRLLAWRWGYLEAQ